MWNKRQIEILGMILLTISLCSASVITVAAKPDIRILASRIRAEFETDKADEQGPGDSEDEVLLKWQAASRDGDKLYQYLEQHKDGKIYDHYGGHYLNEDHQLTVLLSCQSQTCIHELQQIDFETDVIVRYGEFGSYFKTMELLQEINSKISGINISVVNGKGTAAEKELMAYYPCTHYDHLSNRISVSVSAYNEETTEYALKLFKELVGDYAGVLYYSCTKEDVTFEFYSTGIYLGQKIEVNGSNYSTGYRAIRTRDGVSYWGLVTSAHGNWKDDIAYIGDSPSNRIQIGTIKEWRFSDPIDAAFIQLDSGNYASQYVKYSNSTGSTTSTHFVTTSTTASVGNLLYKSGYATYRTSGTISSVNTAGYIGIHYFSSMIAVPEAIATYGDSGGISYKIISGNTGAALGIVEAGDNDITLFMKAPDINTYLSLSTY